MPRTEPDTRPAEAADGPAPPLLRVENLHRHFVTGTPRNRRVLRAVDGVTFDVRAGECLAVVGESGSGKSTLARALMRLVEPTGGKVYYKGRDLLALSGREMRRERRNIQMVFQDPYASLHPRRTVGDVIREAWRVHKDVVPKAQQEDQVAGLLRQVGLPEAYVSLYPSRLSGGERQRVAIARALALRPELLVLDEPVSALDVSIQAQVVHVLMKLHAELGLAYIFISHDLNLVRLVADRVAVMYMGRVVESGTTQELYEHPAHPYTQALLRASPGRAAAVGLEGDVLPGAAAGEAPGPLGTAVGCPYRTRCLKARDVCTTERPGLGTGAHLSACHFPSEQE
ncbi:ABC transporter ATP-binding protein [Streptomyces sp. NPDC050698]